MKVNQFSDALMSVFNTSGELARKYCHTFVGSPHLFLALFGYLNSTIKEGPTDNIEEYEECTNILNTLKGILNSYSVNGAKFKEKFLLVCPEGAEPEPGQKFIISADEDYKHISESLSRIAKRELRQVGLIDLILELFSDRSFKSYQIISMILDSDMKAEELATKVIDAFRSAVIPEIAELEQLNGVLTNLNKWVVKHPQTVVDGNECSDKIQMGLSGRTIPNVVLTGPAGVGKTTYVYDFVQKIVKGTCAPQFKNKVVYQLDPTALISGTRYRGDFEEKLMNILNVVKEHPEVILFVDEMHTLVNLGGSSDGAQSAGNLLKPYITRGEIQLIGATTNEEYTKYILPEKAFAERFIEVKVPEPTNAATKKILQGLIGVEEKFFKKKISDELLDKIILMSNKYTIGDANPRKAIKMLELACAYNTVFSKDENISIDDVIQSTKLQYNIFISENKLKTTKTELFKNLLSQDDALNQVIRNLKLVDANIVDDMRPAMSMLFAGPSGTGKTETARIIARNYFGSDENLIKVDCGEYSNEQDVSKILGSAPGLVGYDDEPYLIKSIREKPNSVILFDSIESL